jgi:hypothetical protein
MRRDIKGLYIPGLAVRAFGEAVFYPLKKVRYRDYEDQRQRIKENNCREEEDEVRVIGLSIVLRFEQLGHRSGAQECHEQQEVGARPRRRQDSGYI